MVQFSSKSSTLQRRTISYCRRPKLLLGGGLVAFILGFGSLQLYGFHSMEKSTLKDLSADVNNACKKLQQSQSGNHNSHVNKDKEKSTICNSHGSLLMDVCFCDVGYDESQNCAVLRSDYDPTITCDITKYDDRCFYHPQYGVAKVSTDRWKSAQCYEENTWAEQRMSDRNDEHAINFAHYSSLLFLQGQGHYNNKKNEINNSAAVAAAAYDTSILGDVIEFGAGPFTQSLTIFQETGLRPKSITLVEPLAETYMNTVHACTYKNGKLGNDQFTIDNTIIIPKPAEEFNVDIDDNNVTKKYDTVILMNMIEHVQDAFIIYKKALDSLKDDGGILIFHERYWPGYDGIENTNKREFDLHPIRLNEKFAHWFATEFDLIYEKEQMERWGNLGYYWIGRKRPSTTTMSTQLTHLSAALEQHTKVLQTNGFDESNIWGNIYNGKDLEQSREYMSYASLPWVKTICEVGFAGGHSTLSYRLGNPNATIYSFDDYGKEALTTLAYKTLQSQSESQDGTGSITLTRGDSTLEVPKFTASHPDVYCDIISVDGAHHEKFPDEDMRNLKYMANYPNIVLIDDYHEVDWPAVLNGVNNRINEGSMMLRHTTASSIIFRNKQKQWSIAEYTMLTVVVTTHQLERLETLQNIVHIASNHPVVQKVVVLWNSNDTVPTEISNLAYVPNNRGNKMSRVVVESTDDETKSSNNRYNPQYLNLHTGAVMILDDDLQINEDLITCAFHQWKQDPSRLYSWGLKQIITPDKYVYEVDKSSSSSSNQKANFLLPRLIFHQYYLNAYFDESNKKIRDYVDVQGGHCDDIAFASVVSKYTQKGMVYLPIEDIQSGTSANRAELRNECTREIIAMLDGWVMPQIDEVSDC